MNYEKSIRKLNDNAKLLFIEEYDEPHYTARELYDKRKGLYTIKNIVTKIVKEMNKEDYIIENISQIQKLVADIHSELNVQIELIKFTESTDGTSDLTETVFTGAKAVWYDRPFREIIYKYYSGDINDFYITVENMTGDTIKTSVGDVPKNLALQFIQNLRLIVSGGSKERYNRGIFKIHHDLQIAPTHVVIILKELDISCRPQCVMKKSESEYERGEAPNWLINLANKPHEKSYPNEEEKLTDEEIRIFAKIKKTELIVMEGGCMCNHKKSDHKSKYHSKCECCNCGTFKLRNNTKRTIEV